MNLFSIHTILSRSGQFQFEEIPYQDFHYNLIPLIGTTRKMKVFEERSFIVFIIQETVKVLS